MSEVSYSQHKFHPHLNVVTIDGEQINGLWVENDEEIRINMYAECDLTDYFGNLLKDTSDTRTKFNTVKAWIYLNFLGKTIDHRSGWSTKTQYWSEWIIKK